MRAVCVSCGFRENAERRSCPKCGWIMIDGPLPAPGSIQVPRRPRSAKQLAAGLAAGALFVLGFGGMAVASFTAADPVVAAAPVAPVADAAAHPATSAPAPAAIPAAPAAVAATSVTKAAPAKKPSAAKKTVAKKKTAASSSKKKTKKAGKHVARR